MDDELLDVIVNILPRMEEADLDNVRKQAHEWWDWDIIPQNPAAVAHYIHDHPTEFRGVVPMGTT